MKLSALLKVAILASLATVLMNLQIAIIPPLPFLKYDASEVPALIAGFAIDPLAGAAVVILKNLIFLATHFQPLELIGVPTNTIAGLTYVLVACSIYHQRKTKNSAKVSLFLGVVAMSIVMIPVLLLLWPVFQAWFLPGQPALKPDELIDNILRYFLPFNLLKGGLTGVLTFFTYKRFSRILKSETLWDNQKGPQSVGPNAKKV